MSARQGETRLSWRLGVILCAASTLGVLQGGAEGADLMVPKEQVTTEFEPTETPSLDVQQKGVPQSLFTWIKMARGYEVEWDTFGPQGWFTQDPRLKPIALERRCSRPMRPQSISCSKSLRLKIQLSSLRRSFVSVSTARRGSRCRPG